MSDLSQKLSAYLDNELTEEEVREIEAILKNDDAAAAELADLKAAHEAIENQLSESMKSTVPLSLVSQIMNAELDGETETPVAANSNSPWRSIAAGVALLFAGGIGGYIYSAQTVEPVQIASAKSWVQYVAEYHGIYAAQKRHLVEVGANEADHIVSWLGATTAVPFDIPDLTAAGYTFQGARLLGVGGKPVAQLLYTDADGLVIAICFQKGNSDIDASDFKETNIDAFNIVSWRQRSASFLVIGETAQDELKDIADSVKLSI